MLSLISCIPSGVDRREDYTSSYLGTGVIWIHDQITCYSLFGGAPMNGKKTVMLILTISSLGILVTFGLMYLLLWIAFNF
ncbi:hypothetical protein D3C77_541340 [compost metagenome]